ncbi:MAG TPA: threonine synthase [Candidatus Acetothermia bacterium]|nr:threonine synthase [Candidatus Acetothermia bacterium]
MPGVLCCPLCEHPLEFSPQPEPCPRCRVPGTFFVSPEEPRPLRQKGKGIWRFRGVYPPATPLHLGEGDTPLVKSVKLGPALGVQLFFKWEGGNPTGSFKDRGASVLVAVLRELGVRKLADDSSGNAGAALAAYAARAGIRARLFVPAQASEKKLRQIEAYGAELVRVPGPRPNATQAVKAACTEDPELIYASHNESPYFLAGLKSLAYELAEAFPRQGPQHVVVPVGGGALFLGLFYGFRELQTVGLIARMPRLHLVQAQACAPLVRAWECGESTPKPVEVGNTVAEGVCIAAPPRGREILMALRETSGTAVAVSEEEIVSAHAQIPNWEGLYVEPTSAVAVAGLKKLMAQEAIRPDDEVVVPLTGTGLKGT